MLIRAGPGRGVKRFSAKIPIFRESSSRHQAPNRQPKKTGRSRGKRTSREGEKSVKVILIAGAAALSLGVSSAYADGGVPPANTTFTQFPGVLATTPRASVAAPMADGPVTQNYVTRADRGTWLFTPNQNQGGNN
jgi:hypothetical protein